MAFNSLVSNYLHFSFYASWNTILRQLEYQTKGHFTPVGIPERVFYAKRNTSFEKYLFFACFSIISPYICSF